jgi:hypothetical protein
MWPFATVVGHRDDVYVVALGDRGKPPSHRGNPTHRTCRGCCWRLRFVGRATILRVLLQHEFERVGGTETLDTDARVISATHRDLAKEVAAGRFRLHS